MGDRTGRALASLVLSSIVVAGSISVAGATPTGAGAGGGGRPLTRPQWIRAANRVCRTSDRKIEALPGTRADPLSDELTPADFQELATLTQRVVTIVDGALVDLRRLRPPKTDRAQVREILAALRLSKQHAEAAIAAAGAQDQEVFVDRFREIGVASDEFEALATAYGSRCGRSSETST